MPGHESTASRLLPGDAERFAAITANLIAWWGDPVPGGWQCARCGGTSSDGDHPARHTAACPVLAARLRRGAPAG